jgi:lipopolysaccharide exporter
VPVSLRRHAFVAVGSSAALSLASDVVRLVTMMVMARLLTPADYGNFALATSVMFWVGAVGFDNFAPNLLRHQGREREISTYLLFGLILQSGLLLFGMVAASVLYLWLERQLVAVLLAVSLLSFPIRVPQEIESQLLQREFRWRRLRFVQLATLLVGSSLSVLLAYKGAGPFALIASILLEPLPSAIVLFTARPIGSLGLNRAVLRSLKDFGWPMVGGSLTGRTRDLMSSWAVGAMLGAAELGLLGRTWGLAHLVLGRFGTQVSYALLPILAAAHSDPARRLRVGNSLLCAIVWSQVPLAVCLALLAAPAVQLLYGERWEGVIGLLPFASAFALVHAVLTLFVPLLIAGGATRNRLHCDAIFLVAAVVALSGLRYGLPAYILAYTAAAAAATLFAGYAVHREGWIDIKGIRNAVIPTLAAGALAMLVASPIWHTLDGTIRAIVSAAVFLLVDLFVLRFFFSPLLAELVAVAPRPALLRRALLLGPTPIPSPER